MAKPLPRASFSDDLTHLALCWRLARQDGIALGFTSHDRSLLIDGLLFEARPGMTPSAVVLGDGVGADDMDIAGALSDAAVTRADLMAGRWDGAKLAVFLVDWRMPDAGQALLAQGSLGDIAVGRGADGGFTATLLGPGTALSAIAVERCSPECRAELGDNRCRVSMRGRERIVSVTEIAPGAVALQGISWIDHVGGEVEFLGGASAGLYRRLIAHEADLLLLNEPAEVAVGDRVRVREGCDKRFSTCAERFGNAVNFRGEPHVPGGDLLLRYGL